MLVVVVAVSCLSAAVVDVVDVVAMRDRDVAAAIAVNMVVLGMHLVAAGGLAFVVVIVMPSMQVTVVQIVDVIAMRDCNMSAAIAVDVRVIDVFVVNCLRHRFLTAVSTRLRLLSVLAHAHLTIRPAVSRQQTVRDSAVSRTRSPSNCLSLTSAQATWGSLAASGSMPSRSAISMPLMETRSVTRRSSEGR